MTEPIITEDELKDFNEGYNATLKLVNKHPELPPELLRNNSALIEVINIYHLKNSSKRLEESSIRLEKSSEKLNCLTLALIGLTVILAVLTGISLWKLFNP